MDFKAFVEATLRGLAQVIFCDRVPAGLCVLAAVAVLAPWAAVGALGGAALATVLRRPVDGNQEEWRLGLTGFNAAIVGMLWGGPLARLGAAATLLPAAILGCLALENLLRPHFRRICLPMLGTPALLVGWISDWTFRAFSDSLWLHPGTLPLGEWSLPIAVACLGVAVATASMTAMVAVGAIAGVSASWSGWWYDIDGLGPVSLWAFSVAPAALGGYVIVPLARVHAIGAALLAATLAAAAWFVWISSPLVTALPPLLAPCLIGVWGAVAAIVHRGGALILDPGVWRLAALMNASRRDGKPVAVLSGAGISTASGIPDYISGAWLDPSVPLQTYAFGSFVASQSCRRAYWSACARFRAVTRNARPNSAHTAITALQRAGWVSAIVTQNVDGLHQSAGAAEVIEIHGAIDHCRCLSCSWQGDWPADTPWEAGDVHCPHCNGMLKPAVIAMGEDLPPNAILEAQAAVARCGVLLIVGTQLAISSASSLLAVARRQGIQIAFINAGPVAQPIASDDLFLNHRAEKALRALALLLGVSIALQHSVRWVDVNDPTKTSAT